MFVDFKRYKRNSLLESQKEFLQSLVNFSINIQDQTRLKSWLMRIPSKLGISSCIVSADLILKSDWGTSTIAKKENNLAHLEKSQYWKGKSREYGGRAYRSYANWADFSVDLSDHYVFSGLYKDVLLAKDLNEQIDLISLTEINPKEYGSKIESIIEEFGLWEFDLYY